MNLCLPFASVYMLALGLNDSQVGLVATIYMLSQVVWGLFSGPITDKLGRRKTTGIFDFITWSIPCLIWWRATNFWFFFVAALINGFNQVVTNSWECLLIEDAEKEKITSINSLIVIFSQMSVFFAPISAIMFSRLTLVPAIRILYLNAFFVMTLKITLCYIFSRETAMGLIRMAETRKRSIISLTAEYGSVLKIILKSRGTVFALALTAITGIVGMLNTTFWQVIVSKKLLVPDTLLPFFPIIKTVVTIIFLFLVTPHLTIKTLKNPLLVGFACYFAGQLLLILAPVHGPVKYIVLCVSLIFDGFGFASLIMLSRSLVALNVNPEERARIMAILNMINMAITAPFGWIGGMLSGISRNLPFVLNLCLLVAGVCATLFHHRPIPAAESGT
jgi:MFS family permease